MLFCFIFNAHFILSQEFYSFMSVTTRTELIVDRSPPTDLLKINFNIR